ncbi:MAG: MerR family transcriptional regulator [Betaproteobacteria bacterium]|nr:MerR family transcriptional regulator [Betaproteobacteria bacterium]MDE2124390.1 MerR family transcriptional regulator [Betaproteobacteria bacterium]MDE2186778.1 MerR family transcriptional regulator [Betaproteobacteria bacterium]MDE2325383.1 MerR family transcriptional regulator [Betaproteobacteria bacterium]
MLAPTTSPYTLAEASRRAGVSVHQTRSYVNSGLVKPRAATSAGYLLFDEDGIARLRLIGAATRAGLLIRDIEALPRALAAGDALALQAAYRAIVRIIEHRQDALEQLQDLVAQSCALKTRETSP